MSQPKIALVTGGSSGIGFGIAQRFLDERYSTIITGRNENKLEAAARELGAGCFPYRFDLADLEGIPDFVQDVVREHGRIDVLVNNAGVNAKKSMLEVTNEEFGNIVRINQSALFALTREVAKVMMKQQQKGSIVHISSMAAHYGLPGVVSYAGSKTAVEGMTRVMAVELSPHGIRVNCIAPGFIETPMSAKALNNDPERKKRVLTRTPMGVLGKPAHVADAAFFLASDQAAFITGEILKVDGGNSIGF